MFYCGWGERWPLATLADNGQALLCEYTQEAMRRQLELSPRMLKLRVAAYGDFPAHQMRLPGLVSDSLPDGWGLLLMDRAFRKAGRKSVSPLDRLAFIGKRAMGALSYEPADPDTLPDEDVKLLDVARSVQSVIEGNDAEVLRRLMLLGGSPQGARPKALVHYDPASGAMRTQAVGAGEPWLMKFPANGEHQMDVCGEGRAPGRADLLRLAVEAALPITQALAIIDKVLDVASNLKASLADCPIRKVRQREVMAAVEANLASLG